MTLTLVLCFISVCGGPMIIELVRIYDWWPHKQMPQMRRFFLSPRKWRYRLYLHHTTMSDLDRDPHDHPWDFWSFMLLGCWIEKRYFLCGTKNCCVCPGWLQDVRVEAGDLIRRSPGDIHRITLLSKSAWTLVLAGPWKRRWGFHTKDGFVDAEFYGDN